FKVTAWEHIQTVLFEGQTQFLYFGNFHNGNMTWAAKPKGQVRLHDKIGFANVIQASSGYSSASYVEFQDIGYLANFEDCLRCPDGLDTCELCTFWGYESHRIINEINEHIIVAAQPPSSILCPDGGC